MKKHEGQDDGTRKSDAAEYPPVSNRIVGSGRTRVNLELRFQGRDLLVLITGGKAHVGAVALVDGRTGGGRAVVTEMAGHREGPLAGECAEILASAWNRTVVVVAGIHQDQATRAEIETIVANAKQGVHDLVAAAKEQKRNGDD